MLPKDVEDLKPGYLHLRCLVCGGEWSPNVLSGGKVAAYAYCCPWCFELEIRHRFKINRNKDNRLAKLRKRA